MARACGWAGGMGPQTGEGVGKQDGQAGVGLQSGDSVGKRPRAEFLSAPHKYL